MFIIRPTGTDDSDADAWPAEISVMVDVQDRDDALLAFAKFIDDHVHELHFVNGGTWEVDVRRWPVSASARVVLSMYETKHVRAEAVRS